MDFKFGEISVKSLDLISFHFKFENSILLFNWSQLDLILLQCVKKGPEILFSKSSVMQLTKSIVEWELFQGKHSKTHFAKKLLKAPYIFPIRPIIHIAFVSLIFFSNLTPQNRSHLCCKRHHMSEVLHKHEYGILSVKLAIWQEL